MSVCVSLIWVCKDSVEEGDKLVKTAIDNFGRIGEGILGMNHCLV